MPEVPIQPKDRFSYARLPRRGRSAAAQFLENFDGLPPPNERDDVLFYKLFPAGGQHDGGGSGDRVEVLGADRYQARVNEIAREIAEMSRQPSESPAIESTTGRERGQYLNVIEFGGGIEQALECLRDDGFHFKYLVSREAVGVPGDTVIPPFGVFLEGNFRIGDHRDQEELALVVRIPYLGPRLAQTRSVESWSLSNFTSQVVPGLGDGSFGSDELSVLQAIFVVLDNAAMIVSRSKDDKGARMVFPQQNRVGAFHVLVHSISETLCGGDRSILADLESRATLLEIQSLHADGGSSRETADQILRRIAAIMALIAEQTAVLEDLKEIFARAAPDFRYSDVHSNKYKTCMLRVPVFSDPAERIEGPTGRITGQMSYVAANLETIIEERRRFSDSIQKIRARVTTNGQAQELRGKLSEQWLMRSLCEQASTQTLLAKAQIVQWGVLYEEIKTQGRSVSAFTNVSLLFLPLGFFSQYLSPGDDNARNGAIGTSLGSFWAVTVPCTLFIVAIVAWPVIKSQYEPRKVARLFADIFKLRLIWPISRADATDQLCYLRKLPKCKVLAVPTFAAGPQPGETGWQPVEGYYLNAPRLSPDAGKDKLLLRVDSTACPGEFRFDESNGWLFCDEVDDYDFMYYANVGSLTVSPVGEKFPLYWKRSRMVMEQEPYRFKGAFRVAHQGSERYLIWRFCDEKGQTRWDTKDISYANDFDLEAGNGGVFLRSPSSGADGPYRLKLIPVDDNEA